MLILTRKPGDTVTIGRNITLTVMQAAGRQVRIGIAAPREVPIRAERLAERPRPKAAAYASTARIT
jgi:carbon storage regulator